MAGEEQLGKFTAKPSIFYRLYLNSGKLTLAAMHLRRVRFVGLGFAAALTRVSTGVKPLAPGAQNFSLGAVVWQCSWGD